MRNGAADAGAGAAFEADLALAVRAAREAGAIVMRSFGRRMDVTHKSPGQPVTAADLEADACIRDIVCRARPDDGWLSEETADRPDRLGRARVWIVDPIDGTRSFIAGRPEFSISIGLSVDGSAVMGVVYNPARDELFCAVRDAGAWLDRNGRREMLGVAPASSESDVVMLASRSEIASGEFDPFRDEWRIEPMGSTAYKLACVAAGRGQAFVSRGPKSEWDVCAGMLLVREAGGCAGDLHGTAPRFNGADPYVHGVVAATVPAYGALLRRVAALPPSPRMSIRSIAGKEETNACGS